MPRLRYRIISVFALLATLLVLLLPGEDLAHLIAWWPLDDSSRDAGFAHMDKLVHAGLFAVCGYYMVLGWLTRSFQIAPLYIGLLVLGGCTEWLQADIAGRGSDSWDLVADAAGAAVGVALGLYSLRRKLPD